MKKDEVIKQLSIKLKEKGFLKSKNTWCKKTSEVAFLVEIQGSQWDKDNYYCNIYGSLKGYNNIEKPTKNDKELWHRLGVRDDLKNQENTPIDYILKFVDSYFDKCLNLEMIKSAYKNDSNFRHDVLYGAFRNYCES